MSFALPKPTNQDFRPTPPGLFLMKLKDMERAEGRDFTTGEPTERMRWIFTIERVIDCDDEEADSLVGEEFWAWTSITMGRKAHMRAYVEALLGRPVEPEEEITSDDLLGRRLKATVAAYTKQNGEPGTKISGVVPVKAVAPKPAAADISPGGARTSPAADEDGDELF